MRAQVTLALVLALGCIRRPPELERPVAYASGVSVSSWARRNLAAFALGTDVEAFPSVIGVPMTFTQPMTLTAPLTLVGGGNALTFSTAAATIKFADGANASIRGNASGTQTAGTWTAAGEIQSGADGYRVAGTGTWDANGHQVDGQTVFTFDASTNLTTGKHTAWRDNGTTELANLDATGNFVSAAKSVPAVGNSAGAGVALNYGEKALSAGVVTLTFTTEGGVAFSATPTCFCTNTSNTTENTCSTTGESTTQVTLNGTTTDTYSWLCIGAR